MPPQVSIGAVFALHRGGLNHPCVVVETTAGESVFVVSSGSSQQHPQLPSILIDHRSRSGMGMRLHLPTYFYERGVEQVNIRELLRWKDGLGRCPPGTLQDLRRLVVQWRTQRRQAASEVTATQSAK